MKKKVGEVLVKLGFLTESQVDEIISIQKDTPDKRFGELALDHGFINNDAINAYIEYIHEN